MKSAHVVYFRYKIFAILFVERECNEDMLLAEYPHLSSIIGICWLYEVLPRVDADVGLK